jgi:hypothetical protein
MECYNARWTPPDPVVVTDELVETRPYVSHHARIGWKEMQVVTVKGWGVMGFITTGIEGS